jgi:GT2 family glycosyltransferase
LQIFKMRPGSKKTIFRVKLLSENAFSERMMDHTFSTKSPKLSVVIPVRDGASTLLQQLSALANQRMAPSFEVIVSDNGSRDNLHDVLREALLKWPSLNLRSVDSSSRQGVSHARNVGTRAALSSLVAFCDSDDVVGSDWVRAMADGLDQYSGVGGALDEYSLNDGKPIQKTISADGLPRGLDFLPYPVGANCGVRRNAWEELNGFDETFLHGAEEVDFYWRLQLAGLSLGFVPNAVVSYRHPSSLRAVVRRAYRYGVGSCQLAATHRAHLPRESYLKIALTCLTLLVRLPLVAVPTRRLNYLRRLAHYAGQIVGSHRYRVLHLA